jgi:hypothetical protein
MDLGVRGKSYVLVGASRGMGLAVARILAPILPLSAARIRSRLPPGSPTNSA